MKIRSLTIDQFKKFTFPIKLHGFEDGLNVISGPNEMGKSTILEAIKAVLFERHKSKNTIIKSFQHVTNDTAPVISLVFEIDGIQYQIEKKFIKSPYAKLTMPGKIVDGDEAEEMLQQLLGFRQAGKSGSSSDTLGLWSVLWVRQGDSLLTELSDLACNTIQSCLEAEVGILTGGQRGQNLLPAIETALNEIIDKRDKPKARYKETIDQLAIVEAQLVEFTSKFNTIDCDLTSLEKAKKELVLLQNDDAESTILKQMESTKNRQKEISEIKTRISLLDKEIKLSENKLETTKKATDDREKLLNDCQQVTKELLAASKAIEESKEDELAKQVADLKNKMEGVDKKKVEAEKKLKHFRKISEVITFQEKLHGLEDSFKLASETYQASIKLKRKADSSTIDPRKVEQLQKATKQKEQALMALQSCATSLMFDIKPEMQGIFQLNGNTLKGSDKKLQIVDEALIELQNIGSIRVIPGINDKGTLTDALEKADHSLKILLEETGYETVQEAESALETKRALLNQADSKLKESQIHAPGDSQINLAPGAIELENYIETLKEAQNKRIQDCGLNVLPSRDENAASLIDIEATVDCLIEEYSQLKTALLGPEATWEEAKRTLIQQQSIHDQAEKSELRLKSQLEAAENDLPKESLQKEISELTKKIAFDLEQLEQAKSKQGQDTLDLLEARIKRLEEQLSNRRNRINELNIEIAGLQNRIQILEAEGLEERIALAEKQEESCKQERIWFEREIQILKLLQKILSEAEADAKERYLAPVVSKIRPHLQVLFPKSTVEIDDNFKITGIVRNGDTVESFEHLSLGTKEQIAVLVRLAFAEMLIEQGKPAALILDDALVFSDDERITLMFDILSLAAKKMQVIVFTCRQKVFESLGGNQIRIAEEKSGVLGYDDTQKSLA